MPLPVGVALEQALVHIHRRLCQRPSTLAQIHECDASNDLDTADPVLQGARNGLHEKWHRQLLRQSKEIPYGSVPGVAAAFKGKVQPGSDHLVDRSQPRLLLGRRLLAVLWSVSRFGLALGAELSVLHPVWRQSILDQEFAAPVDLEVVAVLQHVDIGAVGARHPVEVAVQGGVAVLVRASIMPQVGRGKMRRQLDQGCTLVLEGLDRNQPSLAHGSVV